MANTRHTIGLRPIEQPFGNIRCNYYQAATGVEYYMFQPVDMDANGRVVLAAWNSAHPIIGSIIGILDDNFGPISNSYSGYAPANPAMSGSGGFINLLVADDPQQYFVIEEDTGGTALTSAARGAGADYTYLATTGNTMNGIANVVLDRSGLDTLNGVHQFRLIKKWDKPDNAYGDYCKWVVRIDTHRFTATTGGGLV